LGYLFPGSVKKYHNEDRVWFSGVLDKSTREVISAAIGRRTSLDGDTCDENTDYDCEVVISVHKIQGAMKLK
jgi:hypothetical protein